MTMIAKNLPRAILLVILATFNLHAQEYPDDLKAKFVKSETVKQKVILPKLNRRRNEKRAGR